MENRYATDLIFELAFHKIEFANRKSLAQL